MLFRITSLPFIVIFLFSFTSQIIDKTPKNVRIKSVSVSGELTTKYIYDIRNRLVEIENIHGYSKFSYDEKDRLTREDCAMDPDLYSSSRGTNTENKIMTAQNSTITNFTLFEYDDEGSLKKKQHYLKKTGNSVYTSTTEFVYQNGRVCRISITDHEGIVYQFFTYDYDKKGNVSREKYYVVSDPNYYLATLISETQYRFDSHPNVDGVRNMLGNPGYNTNTNNVIETKYRVFYDSQIKPQITKTTFLCNSDGIPIAQKSNGSTLEYQYYD